MASLTSGEYPPSLSEAEQKSLLESIKDWTLANGLAIRPPPAAIPAAADPHGIAAINVPVTLFPSPFPRQCFEQGMAVQRAYNELYASVSRDEAFLEESVKQVVDGDDFIRQLWDIHFRIKEEGGYAQPLSLGLFRSDYMVHRDTSTSPPTLQAKQVEFNTISSSFGGLSSLTTQLHEHLATTEYPLLRHAIPRGTLHLPENESAQALARGIEAAFRAYPTPTLGHPACVLFLVQPGERNIFDQRRLEYQLTKASPSIPVFRLDFPDLLLHTSLADTPQRQLLFRLPRDPSRVFEVAVAYLRAGYAPTDYPDQRAWEGRHHLERSGAIKCPTVLTHLAGTKKVQQMLAAPSVLSRFMPADAETRELRQTFTNIHPMDESEAGLEARRRALDPQLCQSYVLKPQREGGGNNIYRGAIPAFLRSVPEQHWGSYILMELITPPPVSNLILRHGKVEHGGVICELGVFGTCVWSQTTGEMLHNQEAGYLLRTKGDQTEEGGIAAGFGCMDSCFLT